MKSQTTAAQTDQKLAADYSRNSLYIGLALGVSAFGFIVIYLLAQFGLLGNPAPQLLYIGTVLFLLALGQIPIWLLAKRGRGIAAYFLEIVFVSIFAMILVSLWEGIVFIAALVIIIGPARAIILGLPRRYTLLSLLLAAAGIAGVWYFDKNPILFITERLQTNTPVAIASLAFLGAVAVLLITITMISGSRGFRHLRNQLLLSFIIIVTIPTLMATALSAIGGYVNNETQALRILETVTNLKVSQLNGLVTVYNGDVTNILSDDSFNKNILRVLEAGDEPLPLGDTSQDIARSRLRSFQRAKDDPYQEIMVLDFKGNVVVSTNLSNEGIDYATELFYRQGVLGSYIDFADEAVYGDTNLFISEPIYDETNTAIRGVLVLRSSSIPVKDIVENTPGFEEAETYLVDKNFQPITTTHNPVDTVHTQASTDVIVNSVTESTGTYENYSGDIVLGYYELYDPFNSVFIAELNRSVVIGNSISAILASALLALFAIVLAVAAVAITANFIVEPITALVKTAQDYAEGNLTTRSDLDRADEIGTLGNTYNQMAEQLQTIIGQLEQRVSDRTHELEGQTLRLRVAAEIAKDATSARAISDLLDRAGKLILERFGYYHTGIFLLDSNSEYAVLESSPTEAGTQMIAKGHKLRVGEVGLVGRVAATGEPRISLDTGTDAVHFNNPYLPNTRSEMALPLKAENKIIGVLDVQSEQPQAFNKDDIAIMQVLADQLATAIERTRLFEQVEQNLKELEQAYGRTTREGWVSLADSGLLSNAGYRFDNVRILPIKEPLPAGNEAMRTGNRVIQSGNKKENKQELVAIPIKIRGHAIGAVTVKLKEGYNPTTINTLELAIERLAGSLESARLFEQARLRADREQAISQVTAAISAAPEFDAILRKTVEEIGRSLGNSEVSIQVIRDSESQ